MKGSFGPNEIQINKTVQPAGIFTVKLEDTAPDDHEHIQSEYQLHSSEGLPFGSVVNLDFIVEDAEESMMMQTEKNNCISEQICELNMQINYHFFVKDGKLRSFF